MIISFADLIISLTLNLLIFLNGIINLPLFGTAHYYFRDIRIGTRNWSSISIESGCIQAGKGFRFQQRKGEHFSFSFIVNVCNYREEDLL